MSRKKKTKTKDSKNTIRSPSNSMNTFLLEQLLQRKTMFDGFSNKASRMGQDTTNLLEPV